MLYILLCYFFVSLFKAVKVPEFARAGCVASEDVMLSPGMIISLYIVCIYVVCVYICVYVCASMGVCVGVVCCMYDCVA